MIDFCGEQVSIRDLEIKYDVAWSTINNRYKRGVRGKDLVAKNPLSHIDHFGKKVSISKLSRETGIPKSTLWNRYNQGYRDKKLVRKTFYPESNLNNCKKIVNESQVITIKILLATSTLLQREIAQRFGLQQCSVSDIKTGRRWKHVKVPTHLIIPVKRSGEKMFFMCDECGCVESTVLSNFHKRASEIEPCLCSACDPDIGKWHGEFEQKLAEGMWLDSSGFIREKDDHLPENVKLIMEINFKGEP